MKAVNLVPREAQRSFGSVRGLGGSTAALFGALALAVVVVAAYVVLANGVTGKRKELAQVNAQQAAAQRQVAALKRYDDLEKARTALLDKVRTLAIGRYDWPQALDRLARAIPTDARLTSLSGGASKDGGSGPSFTLNGCTTSHEGVAALIDRLRAVKGVTGVALQSSKVSESPSGDCPHPELFAMTVQLKTPPAAPAATTATGDASATAAAAPAAAAQTTTTPTPASTGGTQ